MKSAMCISRLFLRPNIRFYPVRIVSVLLALMASACTSVPVDNNRSSASARLEAQQEIFEQARELFLDQQYVQAANTLLLLARQGHAGAQYTIGYMYHYGYGVPRNEKESVRWIAAAAARGHPQAEEALARIHASHDQRGGLVMPPQP